MNDDFMTIHDVDEYWKTVDDNWDNILIIFSNIGAQLSEHFGPYGEVLPVTLHEHLRNLKEKRDPEIARYFNAAWAAAPDAMYIHGWKSWGAFCDLCSETWVFDPEFGGDTQ